jgi:chorismate mutase
MFTVTGDLDAAFPADAARAGLGWADVPLMCAREIPVPGALGSCVRVLLAWNTPKAQAAIRHAFLHGARVLRPAWAVDLPGDAPLRVP